MHLKAVVFDFDGTLTKQGSIDFNNIKKNIGCPDNIYLLSFIDNLPESDKKQALMKLDYFEYEAAKTSVEEEGAEEVIKFLNQNNTPIIIITRNSRRSVLRSIENFKSISIDNFYKLISRDDPFPVKPEPDSIEHVARELKISTDNILVIEDYIHDIKSGFNAGSKTIYKITNRANDHLVNSDYSIHSLKELIPIFRYYLPLGLGKLPNNMLEIFLKDINRDNEDIIIGPDVGEDTAAVKLGNKDVLVIKSDPITFTTDKMGIYAVNINLNDIATSGAKGKWITVTMLLPEGIYFDEIQKIMSDINTCCIESNLLICGGHTEITDSVIRPIISCTILGTIFEAQLINKKSIEINDSIIMTKFAGLEGTSIIANDFYDTLIDSGISADDLELCKNFIEDISITPEAEIVSKGYQITALHDVTEGGIATALSELSTAAGHGFEVDIDMIPVHPITKKICKYFSIDPLGLISSGSLIICCRNNRTSELMNDLRDNNIKATLIGKVNTKAAGTVSSSNNTDKQWPQFSSDEITKLINFS